MVSELVLGPLPASDLRLFVQGICPTVGCRHDVRCYPAVAGYVPPNPPPAGSMDSSWGYMLGVCGNCKHEFCLTVMCQVTV